MSHFDRPRDNHLTTSTHWAGQPFWPSGSVKNLVEKCEATLTEFPGSPGSQNEPPRGPKSRVRVRLTPAHPKIARAQGGITPGPIRGELDADFPNLGFQAGDVKKMTTGI